MNNTMKNVSRLPLWAMALGFALLIGGCTGTPPASTEVKEEIKTDTMTSQNPHIAHYVLFWLREDLTEQQVKDFAQFFEDLKAIPGIKSLHYGGPADTHPRDVVDNSFSYNLVVYFDTMEDLEVYENHPIHLEAIAKYSPNWTKVVVHDSWLNQ
jgi:hypothetical protein